MQNRGGGLRRWRGMLAMCIVATGLLTAGATLVTASVASADRLAGANPVFTFWNNYNVVTLDTPSKCPVTPQNPTGAPTCDFTLFVDEPDIPAQTIVGSAVGGLSTVLTVPYPSCFSGVIQADILVGPAPWYQGVGEKATIQTGGCTCGNSPGTSSASSPGSNPTGTSAGCCGSSQSNSTGSSAVAAPAATASSAPAANTSKLHGPHDGSRGGSRASSAVHRRAVGSTARPPDSLQRGAADRKGDHADRPPTGAHASGTDTTSTTIASTDSTTIGPTTQTLSQAGCPPLTGVANVVNSPPSSPSPPVTEAQVADVPQTTTLPFTGLDIRPLGIVGMVLILLGIAFLTTFEQRRRALRMAGRSTAVYSTRTKRWLLGD